LGEKQYSFMADQDKPRHFLVVENDPSQAAMLDQAFSSVPDCGTVAVARNVSEAKAYLKGAGFYSNRSKFPLPSAILCSFRLDGDSGVDLLAWAKSDLNLRAIPFVLLIPGSASTQEIADAKTTGSVRVVKKPANSAQLKGMLDRLAQVMCSDAEKACESDF
jgi:CheY-like chemotaxis protein